VIHRPEIDTKQQEAKGIMTETEQPGRITRWHWEKLSRARNKAELEAVVAEVIEQMGEGDIELKISVSPAQYVRIMQLTWGAYQIREIPQVTATDLVDRALGVYDRYLKSLPAILRQRG
jgi:hypothetical protein